MTSGFLFYNLSCINIIMKKLTTFKDYIKEEILDEPPAIVRRAQSPVAQMLKDALKHIVSAKNYLLQVAQIGNISEVTSGFAWEMIEKIVENDNFKEYLTTNFGNIRPKYSAGEYIYNCGQDSCAFFYTQDYVVKFLGGPKPDLEFKIAQAVKGQLKLVPIVDAVEVEIVDESKIQYVVIMKKLKTDFFLMPRYIIEAANLVSSIVHDLQNLVERRPETSVEYVRKRLSLAYIIHKTGNLDENLADSVKDLMRIIRLVYDKSGMLFGADLKSGRNIGMSSSNKIMVFDYGRPDAHPEKQKELEKIEPKTVYIQ
jgi:hypothetical protein